MRIFVVLISIMILSLGSCRQKDLPIDILAEPVFYVNGKFGADSISLVAGNDGYVNSFNTLKDVNGFKKVFTATLFKSGGTTEPVMTFNVHNLSSGLDASIATLYNDNSYLSANPSAADNSKKIYISMMKDGKEYFSYPTNGQAYNSSPIFTLTKVSPYSENNIVTKLARVQGDLDTWMYVSNGADSVKLIAKGISLALPLE